MLYYPLNSLLFKILRLRVVVGFSIFLLLYVIVGFILNLRLSKYYPNFYEKEKGKVRLHWSSLNKIIDKTSQCEYNHMLVVKNINQYNS